MKETILKVENSPHITTRILYLEATEKELVSRYKETRRSHPLATNGRTIDGIRKEKELLEDIKTRAQVVLDTTNLTPRQLREKLIESFKAKEREMFRVEMVSFGFKYGLPIDADIVMDVKFCQTLILSKNKYSDWFR